MPAMSATASVSATPALAILPLLADPARYRPCPWDLSREPERRRYWIGVFRKHIPRLAASAAEVAVHQGLAPDAANAKASALQRTFIAYLDAFEIDPAMATRHGDGPPGPATVLEICKERERHIAAHGLPDPYLLAKSRENEAALALLPRVLAELDAMPDEQRVGRLIEGVFAGNIFDLGATALMDAQAQGGVDFLGTRAKLAPRPWLFDGLDAWRNRLLGRDGRGLAGYRQAVVFVDNAGCDVVLGMIPFIRDLLARGTRVLVTANTLPSLNDITHDELIPLLARIAAWDAPLRSALADGRLRAIASGNGYPLIDLAAVSTELCLAIAEAPVDLLVLEGMGRGIESNFDARFSCDSLKLAMVKDQGVADALGGKLYDLMMKYERGSY